MKVLCLLTCAGLLFLGACSGHVDQSFAPSVPSEAPVSISSNVEALCGDPVPAGYYRCDALQRTDLFFRVPPAYDARRAAQGTDAKTLSSSFYYSALDPVHLQEAYHLPSSTAGTGQIVGIVDAYDDPNAESEMGSYRAQFGLPACTTANGCFKKLNETGATSPLPAANASWAGEIALDTQMVSAICPRCKIVLVEANSSSSTDLGASVKIAAKAGAHQISNSYGGKEISASDPDYNIPGTIMVASAGDNGWADGPQSPASYSTVVAVGGTSIYPYDNTRGWIETAWSSTGSGCSRYVPRPSWIPAALTCPSNMRPYNDVSAVADPLTSVLVYRSYGVKSAGFYGLGGTSASSPIIAGVYALAGNGATEADAKSIWTAAAAHSTALTDVTIGNNGQEGFANAAGQQCTPVFICYAGPGYDGPTGNGTPYGTAAF